MRIPLSLIIIPIFFFACQESKPDAPEGMVYIPGGNFTMGGRSVQAYEDEFPRHKVTVSPFFMDETEVTNAQFAAFVEATDYITVAEQPIDWEELKKELPPNTLPLPDSVLQPGSLVFRPTGGPTDLRYFNKWWEWRIGANWRQPEGPGSSISDRMNHPVVHIAWEDANAYAAWIGKRLPTETEWEWASLGGDENNTYPWGTGSIEQAFDKANFYQGKFPYLNTVLDGFVATSPVRSYPPNDFGLYDMAGNVWEWCRDKYSRRTYASLQAQGEVENPKGPEASFDPQDPYAQNKYVIRGGSFLCNESYCSGYRTARRMASEANSSANHKGFRCVKE